MMGEPHLSLKADRSVFEYPVGKVEILAVGIRKILREAPQTLQYRSPEAHVARHVATALGPLQTMGV
jgi:hypothetical protein